jgi:hypothetical protein
MAAPALSAQRALGRAPERLTLPERFALTGKFIAMEIYTPENLAERRIEAVGDSLEECVRMLKSRGLAPEKFEFSRLGPPY